MFGGWLWDDDLDRSQTADACGDDVSDVAREQGGRSWRNRSYLDPKTILRDASCGLHQTGRRKAGGSPWSKCDNDGGLARKSNSTNCYREDYEGQISQNNCLNITTVNTVNPVFPVFNIYGIYGKYGIYGQTYQAFILLILFYPRRTYRVILAYHL